MSPSPTPVTQDARRCRQVPRLPRKEPRSPRRHLGTKHATRASPVPSVPRLPRSMSPSTRPATQDARRCRQVPRLPRKEPRRPRRHLGTKHATRASPVPSVPRLPRKVAVDVTKYHACHAKWKWMSPSATPATLVCVDKLCVSKLCVSNVGSWLVWGPPRGLDCSVLCDGSAGEEIEHSMKHACISIMLINAYTTWMKIHVSVCIYIHT